MQTAAATNQQTVPHTLLIALGDVMKFEVLINDRTKVWVFHDRAMPGRLAWVEYDQSSGRLDLVPHDMRNGIHYIDVPAALHMRIQASDVVYFYLTEGDKVTGVQKVALRNRR
ncbi:MAG: hypothetical protein JWO78_1920 [Micavibrio sp.]|nr:hypothetical protein [Micavibrio sp.]